MTAWYRDRAAWSFIARRYLPCLGLLMLAWEIAHSPLYTIWREAEPAYLAFSVLHCTLGDVLIGGCALILALVLGREGFLAHWRWGRIAFFATILGLAYTVFSEWMNVTMLRSWVYAESMPKLEVAGFELGLTPLAQWLVVPAAALHLGRMARPAPALVRGVALRYYARMASPALVALALGALLHMVVNDPGHAPSLGPLIAFGIGAANVLAAWLLLRPIRLGVSGFGSKAAAIARIARLPWLSSGWTWFLATAVMVAPLLGDYAQGRAVSRFMLVYHPLLMAAHGMLMALFIYFLVDDYSSRLKLEMYRLRGWEWTASRGSVATRLLAAYLATALVPFALVFLDVYFADQLESLQMLDLRRAFLLDMVGAMAMTAAAAVFIRRGLVRPLEGLLAGVERVDAGDFTARAPVVSDDELGRIAGRFNRMVEQLREREFLRDTFGRYVPKRVADAILANRGVLQAQQRVATILFTDIEDFTRIVEGLPAERLVALLNEYFSRVMEIVERYGGVVTQIQGDALLVSFNVPLEDPAHAHNALRAALEIERDINSRTFGNAVRFITRVGINTGRVIAAPVGAEHRLIYTVHGDAVNLAARLEALNKEYGTRILVAEATRQLAGEAFSFVSLGAAAVRGRSQPVPIYTIANGRSMR